MEIKIITTEIQPRLWMIKKIIDGVTEEWILDVDRGVLENPNDHSSSGYKVSQKPNDLIHHVLDPVMSKLITHIINSHA